jgi:sulfur-oxidizing protein SoxY
MPQTSRLDRLKLACAAIGLAALALSALPNAASAGDDDWPAIDRTVFDNKPVQKEDGVVALDVPEQVQDAALVPITVRIPPDVTQPIKALTIVIDKNPMPVVARFTFGPAQGSGGERRISTRVRVDNFSHIRAVVETADGKLHMTTKFIAAAGGCAAMNAADPTAENQGLGKLIVKTFAPPVSETPIFEGLIMLKHPNNSGLQIDPNTGDYIPARFVNHMVVTRDGVLVFDMQGGASISANPYFRFTFGRGHDNQLAVRITDTKNTVFVGRSEPSGS